MLFEDEPEPVILACPTPEERIEKVLKKYNRKPKMFPSDAFQAARYWIAHQEQPNERVEAAEPVTVNGKVVGWRTPYHDRLIATLRTFLRMKNIYQLHVIENVEDGIPWRGDQPDFYSEVIKQTQLMRIDPSKYMEAAQRQLRNYPASITKLPGEA